MGSTEIASMPLTMSSLEISGLTGKRHDHVIRDIRKMLQELGSPSPQFWGKVPSAGGRPLEVANLPQRECLILVSGYSIEMRARIIDRWQELESAVSTAAMSSAALEDLTRSLGIMKTTVKKVTAIEQSLAGIVDEAIERRIAADPRVAVVSFVSVKQILADEWKVPAKGRRSIQRKVFVRLQAHCLENGIKAFKCAHSGTWLFPPHEASAFVREHCTGIIRDHLARLNGQTIMRLVPKEQRSPKVRSELIAEAAATFGPKAAADLSQSI